MLKASYTKALMDYVVYRRHITSKGFKRVPGGDIRFRRQDADLYYDVHSGKWICDVYTTQDGERVTRLTRRAHPILIAVLRSVI